MSEDRCDRCGHDELLHGSGPVKRGDRCRIMGCPCVGWKKQSVKGKKDATIASLRAEVERLTRALAKYTEASSSKTDWCPCCRQGWECASDDQKHRVELNQLRTLYGAAWKECEWWRKAHPNMKIDDTAPSQDHARLRHEIVPAMRAHDAARREAGCE